MIGGLRTNDGGLGGCGCRVQERDPGRVRGRAKVMDPGEVRGQARVGLPDGVSEQVRVGTGDDIGLARGGGGSSGVRIRAGVGFRGVIRSGRRV